MSTEPSFFGYFLIIFSLFGLAYYSSALLTTKNSFGVSVTPELLNSIGNILWPLITLFAVLYLAPIVLTLIRNGDLTIETKYGKVSGSKSQEIISPNVTPTTTASAPNTANLNDLQKHIYEDLKRELIAVLPDVREEKLLSALSIVIYSERFERLYNIIFGTQLQALVALAQHIQPNPQALYELYTKRWAAKYSVPPASYDMWLGFMVSSGLIGVSNGFHIERYGQEFLSYLMGRGYLLDKDIN